MSGRRRDAGVAVAVGIAPRRGPSVCDVVTRRPPENRRSSFACSELYSVFVPIHVVTSADLPNGQEQRPAVVPGKADDVRGVLVELRLDVVAAVADIRDVE